MDGLYRDELQDGYEQGGLLYFRHGKREYVAIIRDRAEFDMRLEARAGLWDYVNAEISAKVEDAARAVERLIPLKRVFPQRPPED